MDARWMREETPTEPHEEVIEIDADSRRALRRALKLECELICRYWDEPVRHRVSDLSPYGAWIDTFFPLHEGAEVVVAFTPPRSAGEITVFGRVMRASTLRYPTRGRVGMGVEFSDLTIAQERLLERCLRGIPPRLVRHTH
jgi:hypothetical protein